MHNALQGADITIPHADLAVYLQCLRENAWRHPFEGDVVIVHDPQPAYLIQHALRQRCHLVWRCHIDLSRPHGQVGRFLQQAVRQYAMAVFHVPQFAQHLPIPQGLIAPSIDPLSPKN
jgi:trehalose synthase